MPNVTLKQLRAFAAICQKKSFTHAAEYLNISQSALTLQIHELETTIGLRLFDRTSRSVELTLAAREFQPVAERLLEELDGALGNLRAVARRQRGSVTVVAGGSVIALAVAPAITSLSKSFPGVSIRITEHAGEEASARVAAGQADFGIANFIGQSEVIESALLLKDQIGILCHPQHPLARKKTIRWKDLTNCAFATTLAQGTSLRERLYRDPAIGAALPLPKYEASNVSVLMSIVEQDAAIAILPSLAALPASSRGLVFRPVQEPSMLRDLFFVAPRRRSLTPAAAQVAVAILDQFKKAKTSSIAMTVQASNLNGLRQKLLDHIDRQKGNFDH